jgi:predicted TIM-barrel fold metal-dependent hydrolase
MRWRQAVIEGAIAMTYANGRTIFDADSHLMELPDFLTAHADPAERALMPTLGALATGQFNPGDHVGTRGHSAERVAELTALGDGLTRGPKWHDALGSFSGAERTVALDLLGFQRQVVFSSFCARPIFEAEPRVKYPTARAHNRAMAEFCRDDPRLIGVGIAPLDDVALALAEIDHATSLGLGAIWIAAAPPGGRSPGHVDHEPIWATLAERGLPFILHVGSSPLSIDSPWMNDGRPDRRTARGGAEVIGSKDLTVIHQAAQKFISVLVLDGVLERHPGLRGAVVELGAGWVPDMIRRLDHAHEIWAKSEPFLAEMRRRPSEQIRRQLRFTPYPFEDVAAFIAESAPELYLFSSDYPHAEGGRDPIGRFDRALAGADGAARDRFYAGNFRDLYPNAFVNA